jgi:UDP-4-amino-4,6-dideoxy-N-acetyl-beta-L-altrosamine N-acetyltransferase
MNPKDVEFLEIKEEHLELIRNWRNDPEVSKYMYTDSDISETQQWEWYKRIKKTDNRFDWVFAYEGKLLGVVSIYDINKLFNSCYWAFYIGNTSIRGAGIGSKVEFNVLSHAFNILKLNKLRCEVFSTNNIVIEMHEKFGFRREGYFRQHLIKNDRVIDVVALAILRSEWDGVKDFHQKRIYNTSTN